MQQRPFGHRLAAVQAHVDHPDVLEGARRDQGRGAVVAALVAALPAEAQGDPRDAGGPLDLLLEALDAADPDAAPVERQLVADPHGPGREGAGDDRAGAPDVELPVGPEAYVGVPVRIRELSQDPDERVAQRVEPRAGAARHGDRADPGQ